MRPGSPTRLAVAVNALGDLMDQLAKRGNTQVGVLFYGHRAGWNNDAKKIVRQTGYDPNIDKELLPLEDVETVATLGRFDATAANFVKSRMKRLQPWGETPLFLSIRNALEQLAIADAASNRRIVVITDGENNQFVPRDLQLTPEQTAKLTVLEDVLGTLRKNPIPVHILGFEMNAEETRKSQTAFHQITQASGGSYLPAVNARMLFATIEALLGPSRYSVLDESGKTLASAALGSPVTLKRAGTASRRVTVAVGAARGTFAIEGGEAFQLVISKNGNAIESVRYTAGKPRFAPLVIGELGTASGILAGVHLPVRDGQNRRDVTFPISFQREDRGVTRRFGDVWIEITPLAADGQPIGQTYVFLDAQYAAGMPVPVVKLLATNWPKNAGKAAIRIWCRNRRTKPTKNFDIANLISSPAVPGGSTAASEASVAGTEIRVHSSKKDGRFFLRVIEKHPAQGLTYVPLRIEVTPKAAIDVTDAFEASTITRRFDVINRVTVHTFEFAANDEASVRKGTLKVTTRDAVIGSPARKLARPMVIEVAKPGGVIRLDGPAIRK
ncbi:MAG: VWA domain-containing protein [Planctomycetes bacterium]|nr:VWA domain-containing protein [Planctomycetota bacterium]